MNERLFAASLVQDMLSGWASWVNSDRSALAFLSSFVGDGGLQGFRSIFDIAYDLGKEHRLQYVLPEENMMRISRYKEALEILPDPVKFNTPLGRPLLQLEQHAFVLSYIVGFSGRFDECSCIGGREEKYLRRFCLKGWISCFRNKGENEVLVLFSAWLRSVNSWLKDAERVYEHEKTIDDPTAWFSQVLRAY